VACTTDWNFSAKESDSRPAKFRGIVRKGIFLLNTRNISAQYTQFMLRILYCVIEKKKNGRNKITKEVKNERGLKWKLFCEQNVYNM